MSLRERLPVEQEVASLLPINPAPEIVEAIREAVREARGLPAEATVLTIPPRKKDPK